MDWKKQPKIVKDSIESSINSFAKLWNITFRRDYRMKKIKKIYEQGDNNREENK
jgi:hypothetical protein